MLSSFEEARRQVLGMVAVLVETGESSEWGLFQRNFVLVLGYMLGLGGHEGRHIALAFQAVAERLTTTSSSQDTCEI
jgi:hypothetical protein